MLRHPIDPASVPLDDPVGRLLLGIQELMVRLEARARALARGGSRGAFEGAMVPVLGGIGALVGLAAGIAATGGLDGGIFGMAVGAGAGFGFAKLPVPSPARAADRESLALARRLHEQVLKLAGRSFVEVVDGTVFVNAPHRAFLTARIRDVERAVVRLIQRDGELVHLRAGLVDTNERLGRPAEDEEVAAVDAERDRIARQIEDLDALRGQLIGQLERFEEALEKLRLMATRRALSERVSGMLERSAAEEARRAASAIEIDVAELEARFEDMALELSDADAALRAVLEIETASRAGRLLSAAEE
ncbi:MAG: hypothetical protein H6739_02620 [Alphaproteobacteria bacterium]|nr:hypothetical protein [Alphaproteobacteria bacterium]